MQPIPPPNAPSSHDLDEITSNALNSSMDFAETEDAPLLQDEEASRTPESVQHNVFHRLYISHALSTFNARVFEFGAVLYLASIFPGTLLPMSVYVICRNSSAICLGAIVGNWIDRGNRLKVVRTSIVGGRLTVAASCVLFWLLKRLSSSPDWVNIVSLALLIVFACAEKICGTMNLVAVERDWVVVIAQGDEDILRNLNATIRRIDLICKLGGPFAIALLDGYSTEIAILVTLGMNLVSVPIEYYAIERVYKTVAGLQEQKRSKTPDNSSNQQAADSATSGKLWRSCVQCAGRTQHTVSSSLRLYFFHKVFLPSFSLALLYLNVMSFSGQMVTYLASVGYSSIHIGIARTISVFFEISATWLGPFVTSRIGPIRSGIWFINWQIICLFFGVGIFWYTDNPILAATALVSATILSRVGLWGFDLSAQMIVQEEVEPDIRGHFSSIEASWQNAFELMSYTTTIIFSRPEQFRWPVMVSCCSVLTAAVLYSTFVRFRRGHLLHVADCFHHHPKRTPNLP